MQIKKGTYLNPFENVDEAFDYLVQLEQCKYAADKEMRRYHKPLHVCDMSGRPIPSWLLPDTASIAYDYPSDAFIVTKQLSGRFQFKPNISRRKFLYRGQHTDYPTCTPNIFRNPKQDYFLSEMILSHEMWEVIKSHPLFRVLSLQGIDLNGFKFQMFTNYGGISQHYYNKTTFLDLTSDINTAKFFACCDYVSKTDSYKPHLAGGIGVIYFYEITQPDVFQPHPPSYHKYDYHLSTIGKQVFPRSGAQHGFLLDMRKGLDLKDIPLADKIYFKHNPGISTRIFETDSLTGKKYMPDSPLDAYWYEKMSHPKTAFEISEGAVKTNLSLNPFETVTTLTKKLTDRGFRIVRKTSELSSEYLSVFYNDIRNGWWHDEFCKDIYFFGKDGIKYQEAFCNFDITKVISLQS